MPFPVACIAAATQRRKGQNVAYLLRDMFTTDRAAGTIDGTAAEPGPGTRQVEADSGNNLAITGGRIVSSGIVAGEDPKFGYDDAIARVAGRTVKYTIQYGAARSHSGVTSAPGDALPYYGIYEASGNLTAMPPGQTGYNPFTTGVDYTLWIALLASGAALWVQGGVYTSPTLLFVSDRYNTNPMYLYPIIARLVSCSIQVDNVEVVDVPSLASRELLATVYEANPANGVNYTTSADSLHCLTFTLPGAPAAGNTIGIHYRQQDATNYWHAYVSYDGAQWDFDLDKVTAGVAASLIHVDGVGTPDEIFVIAAGNEHWCFTAAADVHTMRGTKKTDAAFNAATEVGAWYNAGTTALLESFARTWTL